MFNNKLKTCPVCDSDMELGFSGRSSPLSFVSTGNIQKFTHRDEDLNQAGLKVFLPARASYDAAYHCRSCKLLIVDYSRKIPSKEAKTVAASVA